MQYGSRHVFFERRSDDGDRDRAGYHSQSPVEAEEVNTAQFQKFDIAVNHTRSGTLVGMRHWLSRRWPMPRYYFDIKDGHGLGDPSGLELKNDDAAIAKAKVIAIGVSLDKPAVDPKRHIAVLNGSREEIFRVPVYSKPSMSTT